VIGELQRWQSKDDALDFAQQPHQVRLRGSKGFAFIGIRLVLDQLLERHREFLEIRIQLREIVDDLRTIIVARLSLCSWSSFADRGHARA